MKSELTPRRPRVVLRSRDEGTCHDTHVVPTYVKPSKRHPKAVQNALTNRVEADHRRWAKFKRQRKAGRAGRKAGRR